MSMQNEITETDSSNEMSKFQQRLKDNMEKIKQGGWIPVEGSPLTFEKPLPNRVAELYGQQYEDSIEYMRICTRLFSELKMVEVSGGLPAEAAARVAKEFENFKKVILKEQKI